MLYAAGNGEEQLLLYEKLHPVCLGGDALGKNGIPLHSRRRNMAASNMAASLV
jgi:hypothetical protein